MGQLTPDKLGGQMIRGYVFEDMLGIGRCTVVYRARTYSSSDAPTVTVTFFLVPQAFSQEARERFFARFVQLSTVLVHLHHPALYPVYSFGEQWGYPYLLMPEREVTSLAGMLREQGACPPAQAVRIIERVAEALEYAQTRGLVHRGLKPGHVFLHPETGVQLSGLGLIQLLEVQGIETCDRPYPHLRSIAGTFLGAPEYLAPEVFQGQSADARSDVYSLGILLFELLSGVQPFSGLDFITVGTQHLSHPLPSLHELCPTTPRPLEIAILKALKRDPAQRFQRPGDLAAACTSALSQKPAPLVSASTARWIDLPALLEAKTQEERTTEGSALLGVVSRESRWIDLSPPLLTTQSWDILGAPAEVNQDNQEDISWLLSSPISSSAPPIQAGGTLSLREASAPVLAATRGGVHQAPVSTLASDARVQQGGRFLGEGGMQLPEPIPFDPFGGLPLPAEPSMALVPSVGRSLVPSGGEDPPFMRAALETIRRLLSGNATDERASTKERQLQRNRDRFHNMFLGVLLMVILPLSALVGIAGGPPRARASEVAHTISPESGMRSSTWTSPHLVSTASPSLTHPSRWQKRGNNLAGGATHSVTAPLTQPPNSIDRTTASFRRLYMISGMMRCPRFSARAHRCAQGTSISTRGTARPRSQRRNTEYCKKGKALCSKNR